MTPRDDLVIEVRKKHQASESIERISAGVQVEEDFSNDRVILAFISYDAALSWCRGMIEAIERSQAVASLRDGEDVE